ncbi:MAG: hypothetical protein ACE5G0_07930 [Rhodothermales bacterium]
MKDLIHELIPHAPQMGLYVAPHIPEKKVRNALHDYARSMQPEDVIALFDATLMGSGKDGAVFAIDRFIFQNNDLEHAQEVRYEDIVRVDKKRGLLKGAKVYLEVNRGRATFDVTLDCSGKPDAMEFLYRFLHEAMLFPIEPRPEPVPEGRSTAAGSDLHAVQQALDTLRAQGLLADLDYRRILDVLK